MPLRVSALRLCVLLPPWGATIKTQPSVKEVDPHWNPTMILLFPDSKTMRNKFLLFVSHPIQGVRYHNPNQVKTHYNSSFTEDPDTHQTQKTEFSQSRALFLVCILSCVIIHWYLHVVTRAPHSGCRYILMKISQIKYMKNILFSWVNSARMSFTCIGQIQNNKGLNITWVLFSRK